MARVDGVERERKVSVEGVALTTVAATHSMGDTGVGVCRE